MFNCALEKGSLTLPSHNVYISRVMGCSGKNTTVAVMAVYWAGVRACARSDRSQGLVVGTIRWPFRGS